MRFFRFPAWMPAVALCLLAAGCMTNGESDLSKLLAELEAKHPELVADVDKELKELERGAVEDSDEEGYYAKPNEPDRGLSPLPSTASGLGMGSGVMNQVLTIQPDCLVQINVEEDPALDGNYPVNDIGAVQLGYIGPVILYNKTEDQAAGKIREVLRMRHFKKATVRVKILRASYDKVRIVGAVNQPGVIKIGAGDTMSLNDALLRAGGLRPSVKGAKVRIVRNGMLSALAFAQDGEEYPLVTDEGFPDIPDIALANNDIAYVFSSSATTPIEVGEKEILVLGEVRRPGVYKFSSGEPCTVMHLIFKMGGLPPYANSKAVKVIRQDESGREEEFVVNAEEILSTGDPEKDVPIENGDRIVVPARRITLF